MVLLLVFMQLTRDLFAIAKFLLCLCLGVQRTIQLAYEAIVGLGLNVVLHGLAPMYLCVVAYFCGIFIFVMYFIFVCLYQYICYI